jgi:3-oxoadipate enol-lactonase
MHYRLHGRDSAPALVLVNSLGTDARIWDGVIELLSDDYCVISYDKRGHGLSGAPSGEYALSDHVGDLAALADVVGAQTFVLCGLSVGGVIAQGFALQYPDRLAGLVLCDTAPRIGDAALWRARIETVRERGIEELADGLMERWFTQEYRDNNPAQVEGWRTMLTRMPPAGYIGTCATLRDADLSADIVRIRTPTLVVVGDADRSTPPALVKQCAGAIPGARFHQIASSGHLPSIDQPGALAARIRSFLKEIGHG